MSSEVLAPGTLGGMRAVVTGSSAGIGRAIAARLLALGAEVYGVDRASPALGGSAFHPLSLDLSDGEATQVVARALGGVDALVHAAGVMAAAPLGKLDASTGERMWRVHVEAISRLADVLVPGMAARGKGRVVLVGSRIAQGFPGRSQYASVKAAEVALARSWAGELVANGVTVNVVSPAATATAMLEDPARAASRPRMPPLGRYVHAEEVAEVVAFLLSSAAAAVTGQNLEVCGGSSLPS